MNFTSTEYYLFFLPIVLLSVFLIWRGKKHEQIYVLLIFSWIFFWFASEWHLILLLLSTLIDWNAGKFIYNSKNTAHRRQILLLSLSVNLTLLGTFKYLDFFIESFNFFSFQLGSSNQFSPLNLLLPVGISFYTFQTMSYTIDIYQGKIKPMAHFSEFACYAAFFPQLVAGPIVRNDHFSNQIKNGLSFNSLNIKVGMTLIVYGLFKKIVIADNIANQVNNIFIPEADLGNFFLVFYGSFLFGIQIYCDFSAYSTIAIGSAKLFGINLPQNFNHPFFSKSPEEYWKRWHISLSSWLRDYLYTPIAIRSARNRESLNKIVIKSTMITMLLGGLWHGAGWNFVLWGFVHGLMIVIHQILKNSSIFSNFKSINSSVYSGGSWFLTQLFVIFTWILFRVQDNAMLVRCVKTFFLIDCNFEIVEFYTMLSVSSGGDFYVGRFFTFGLVLLFIIFHYLSYKCGGLEQKIANLSPIYWGALMGFIIGCTILFRPMNPVDFIYFRF